MDLHPVDDLPFHQAPTPFNVASTSDVHFNDGYWFATYTDDVYLTGGLRVQNPVTYRGDELVIEHDEYDVDPRRPGGGPPRIPEVKRVGPTEFPARADGPGGAVGMAHFEHYLGPYPRYGFDQSA